jgi:LysM repeat protein
VGNSYCVERNYGLTPETPTSSTPPTLPTPTNGVATPSPIQTGMVSNCNKFYLVVKDDGCYDIASKSSISLDQLYLWNPAVGNECRSLFPANYICIGVIGGSQSPSPTAKPTNTPSPTTSPNGVNTPSPIQPGMTSSCDEFYLVKDKDTCYDIAKSRSITLDQLYAWNPTVGNTCAALWPGNYICVSIIGVSPTTLITMTTPTTTKPWQMPPLCTFDLPKGQYVCPSATPTPSPTTPGNGIATPTPFQSGMTANCRKFYKAVRGDGCWAIANTYKIDLNEFYKWNPAVGSSCASLWPDNYVCVGL